jgi:hypothetical protein
MVTENYALSLEVLWDSAEECRGVYPLNRSESIFLTFQRSPRPTRSRMPLFSKAASSCSYGTLRLLGGRWRWRADASIYILRRLAVVPEGRQILPCRISFASGLRAGSPQRPGAWHSYLGTHVAQVLPHWVFQLVSRRKAHFKHLSSANPTPSYPRIRRLNQNYCGH